MKPAPFKYFDPASPDEALALLHEWGEEGKVLAGGQTLGPMLNFRVVSPAALIDINHLENLAYHRQTESGTLIGALTRQRVLEDDEALALHQPLVAAAIPYIAHRAIRNRGTVGGSLAHADPAAEWGALILTLGAELKVRRYQTPDRVVAAANFFHGMLETALAPDELLVEIRLPPWPKGAGWSMVEFSRRHGDFALAGIASMISVSADGTCSDVRITAFGVEPRPVRLAHVENSLHGNRPDSALIQESARRAAAEMSPMTDNHASAGYRRHLVEVLAERSLEKALTRSTPP
jgi:aerobic carbon-monoxide dehydrogenase medium subunit